VQLTEGAAISAANCSFNDGSGMRALLKICGHHNHGGRPWGKATGLTDGPAQR